MVPSEPAGVVRCSHLGKRHAVVSGDWRCRNVLIGLRFVHQMGASARVPTTEVSLHGHVRERHTRSCNRGGGIRTRDLLVPNQARYRTAPHPEKKRRLDAEMPRRRGEAKDVSGYGATVTDLVTGV